jgi:hypothetical protein
VNAKKNSVQRALLFKKLVFLGKKIYLSIKSPAMALTPSRAFLLYI